MKRILIGIRFIFTGKIHGIKEHHIEGFKDITSVNADSMLNTFYELERRLSDDFKSQNNSFMKNYFSEVYNNKINCDIVLGKYKRKSNYEQ